MESLDSLLGKLGFVKTQNANDTQSWHNYETGTDVHVDLLTSDATIYIPNNFECPFCDTTVQLATEFFQAACN